MNASQDNIAIVDGFASTSEGAVAEAVGTIFDDDVEVTSIVRVLVCPGTFAAFLGYGVIIDRHIAVLHQYIAAYININGICTWSLYRFLR